MSKALEALEKIKQEFGCDPAYYGLNLDFETIEQALQRLGTIEKGKNTDIIDNYMAFKNSEQAKPSEALTLFRSFKNGMITDNAICITKAYFDDKFPTIENALLKAEKLEQVLEIIKNKCVDIYLLKSVNELEKYNKLIGLRGIELTQKEFDLLKEMLIC